MPDYEKMYFQLAARVSDAIELLVCTLRQGEDYYITDDPSHTPTDREDKQMNIPKYSRLKEGTDFISIVEETVCLTLKK